MFSHRTDLTIDGVDIGNSRRLVEQHILHNIIQNLTSTTVSIHTHSDKHRRPKEDHLPK